MLPVSFGDTAIIAMLCLLPLDCAREDARRAEPSNGKGPIVMKIPPSSVSQDRAPPPANSGPLFLAAPPLEHPWAATVRTMIFIPRADHLHRAASAEEIAPAVKDTQAWLERILRPEIFEAFRDARWVGFREGTFEEIGASGHVVFAAAMTGLGEVQVLGFSTLVTLHFRLLPPNPSSPASAWLRPSLELADRILQIETPKVPEEWGMLFPGQFLFAVRGDWKKDGWKGIELVTDGHGVAVRAYKIPEMGYYAFKRTPDFNELVKPDPNWFAPPPTTRDR
jgi:hypothetical protein